MKEGEGETAHTPLSDIPRSFHRPTASAWLPSVLPPCDVNVRLQANKPRAHTQYIPALAYSTSGIVETRNRRAWLPTGRAVWAQWGGRRIGPKRCVSACSARRKEPQEEAK